MPRWAGYRLGYYYVKKYLEKTGRSIEEATLDSYKLFILRDYNLAVDTQKSRRAALLSQRRGLGPLLFGFFSVFDALFERGWDGFEGAAGFGDSSLN